MTTAFRIAQSLCLVTFMLPFAAVAQGPDSINWRYPTSSSQVSRPFDQATTYGPGHRGIDLVAPEGGAVNAVADGIVVWAGKVAGRYTISIDHGGEKSTYEPVKPSVKQGQRVTAGTTLGTLQGGHCEKTAPCLHLGRIRAGEYLDPLELLTPETGYRLISPVGAPPSPPRSYLANGKLPIRGIITSRFGMRVHPVTKQPRLHDGIDIAAPCGLPIPAIASGKVVSAGWRAGYGNYVQIAHSGNTHSAYAHLSTIGTKVGQRINTGTILGEVGNTGNSTGCHLHFMRIVAGTPQNPER